MTLQEQERKIVLQAEDIGKSFYTPKAVQILRSVALTLLQGDSIAIRGRSGEGKTTLLHILGTLETPCQGDLIIGGEKVTRINTAAIRNRHIGFIFQSFHLLENYTALDNILMPAQIGRQGIRPGSAPYQRALDLLDKVGLASRAHYSAKVLSGGEKQRVAIARALINDPDIILADEPTGNLDGQTSQQIQDLLFHCSLELNKALIIVTHDDALAQRCSKRYKLQDGFLLQEKGDGNAGSQQGRINE